MKIRACCLFGVQLVIALLAVGIGHAQPPGKTDPKKPPAAGAAPKIAAPKPADPNAKEYAAIQQSSKSFVDAFNKGDAKAIAALWNPAGELIDEAGVRFEGRPAIEKEYAAFFNAHPGAKIQLAIDSLRMTSENTAVEDGRSIVETGPAGVSHGRYTAMHVKSPDGKWLISSVRDAVAESSAAASQVRDLEWLVGTWAAEENGGKMEMNCRWIADKNFLERTFVVKRGDKEVSSGKQVIGWNPQGRSLQSWTFTSDGGHAIGMWIPRLNGWAIDTSGMLADGTPTTAVNLFTRIDDNTFSWQSVERTVGGTPIANTPEVVLKRAATAAPAKK